MFQRVNGQSDFPMMIIFVPGTICIVRSLYLGVPRPHISILTERLVGATISVTLGL